MFSVGLIFRYVATCNGIRMMVFKLRISKLEIGTLIFMILYAAVIWYFYLNYSDSTKHLFTPIVLTILPIILLLFYYLNTKGQIVITEKEIMFMNTFKKYTLNIEDITKVKKHFINPNLLFLITSTDKYKLPLNVNKKSELINEIQKRLSINLIYHNEKK